MMVFLKKYYPFYSPSTLGGEATPLNPTPRGKLKHLAPMIGCDCRQFFRAPRPNVLVLYGRASKKNSAAIAATDPETPRRNSPRGFTLVELVVSIGIFAAIILVTIPSVKKLGDSRAVEPADHLVALLTSAARRARNGADASAWGLYLPYDPATRLSDDVILFSGNSYATRDASQDIAFTFDDAATFDSVELSGAAPSSGDDHETVFAALTGEASLYGNVMLTFRGNTRTLIVSPSGFITVNP